MTDYSIPDDNLIALSYIESILTEDYDRALEIEKTIDSTELIRGLMLAGIISIDALAKEWGWESKQVIELFRQNTLNIAQKKPETN